MGSEGGNGDTQTHLTLASERAPEIVEREKLARESGQVEHQLRWVLREHAANLMRVVRGAGKAYEIGPQAAAIVRLFERYREITGVYPSASEVACMLQVERDDDRFRGCDNDDLTMMFAQREMVRGALQIAASELLGQRTQEARGEDELFQGLQRHEKARGNLARKMQRKH